MLDGVVSRLQLKTELGSLGNHLGQLMLHYQPILSAHTGRMTGLEALMRWQHPSRGLLYPTSFIEFAEETGAIVSVGAAAMDMACAQAAAWRDLGISCPMISVNLSARQLHHRGVVEMVERSLHKYGLPPGDLTIEITESVTMGGVDQAIDRLQQLKDLGVSIAIDDFGTGWSSLSYLRRLPVDFVKFDRTFTADVATDQDAALLISLMNKLAHALGLETVAEGIETAAQLAAVRRLGCDHVQGFHLARPAAASAVTDLIREHRNHARQPQLASAFSDPVT
jgi:EAL domain-containing protein (putative c-di-GMP-specific phosphodiesterase class I)